MAYQLSLPVEAVRARLTEAVDRPTLRYWTIPTAAHGRPVIGEIGPDRFWWRVRHQRRASFAPWLSGRIWSSPAGSTVEIGIHSPLTRRVQAVIGIAVILLIVLWRALIPSPTVTDALLAGVAVLAVLGLPLLGASFYTHERRVLLDTFERIFADAIRSPTKTDRTD
jgi:hypothetical protein